MDYSFRLEKIDILENKWQQAVNQSEVYRLVKDHFSSPLPDGKKVKKAAVIGIALFGALFY